jgi:type IV secretion system protein VirB8
MSGSSFQGAENWEFEQHALRVRTTRGLAILLTIVSAVALAEAGVIVTLLPLKTPVPVLYEQDRETGELRPLDLSQGLERTKTEALAEFNLLRYVQARETWDPDGGQENHQLVYTYSTPEVWDEYVPLNQRGAPGNRIELYGANRVAVRVKSISFLGPEEAQVRFSTTWQGTTEHWISTLRYTYGAAPSDFRARQQNPLGFLVTHYRRDQEVVHAERN